MADETNNKYRELPAITNSQRKHKGKLLRETMNDVYLADTVIKELSDVVSEVMASNASQWKKFSKSLLGGIAVEFLKIRRQEAMSQHPHALFPLRKMMIEYLEGNKVLTEAQLNNVKKETAITKEITENLKREKRDGTASESNLLSIGRVMEKIASDKISSVKILGELSKVFDKIQSPRNKTELEEKVKPEAIETIDTDKLMQSKLKDDHQEKTEEIEEDKHAEENHSFFAELVSLAEDQKQLLQTIAENLTGTSMGYQDDVEDRFESSRKKKFNFDLRSFFGGSKSTGQDAMDSGSSFLGKLSNMILSPEFITLSLLTGWAGKLKSAIMGVGYFMLGSLISIIKAPFKWLKVGGAIKKALRLATRKPFFVAGLAGLVTSIFQIMADGFEGYAKGDDFNTSKISAAIGSAIAGTSKGLWGNAANAAKWGFVGLQIGMLGGPVGMLAGAIVGASLGVLANVIGPEVISQWVEDTTHSLKKTIDVMFNTTLVLNPKTLEEKIGDIKSHLDSKMAELADTNSQIADIAAKIIDAAGNPKLIESLSSQKKELENRRDMILSNVDRDTTLLSKFSQDLIDAGKTHSEKLRTYISDFLMVSDNWFSIASKLLLDPTGMFSALGDKIAQKVEDWDLEGMIRKVGETFDELIMSVNDFFKKLVDNAKKMLRDYTGIDLTDGSDTTKPEDMKFKEIVSDEPVKPKTANIVNLLDSKAEFKRARDTMFTTIMESNSRVSQSIVNNSSTKNTQIQGRVSPIDSDSLSLSSMSFTP